MERARSATIVSNIGSTRSRNTIGEESGFPQGDDHPVVTVGDDDALAFSQWLSQEERAAYRLPTEAEWEHACRAGTSSRYWFGDDPELFPDFANLRDATVKEMVSKKMVTSASDGYVFTAPVGSLRPNPFGLYNMHGNVGERCADWYDDDYYASSPLEDPLGPLSGEYRVSRRGSWITDPLSARSAGRGAGGLLIARLGFRVVCEIEADAEPTPPAIGSAQSGARCPRRVCHFAAHAFFGAHHPGTSTGGRADLRPAGVAGLAAG